ncbi:MAG: hypothetical protein U9M95_03940 [Candidatus Altiarchaeota archaeon]|nr:hypothetical protein [Candidatus Altiarchaeota archaeon]
MFSKNKLILLLIVIASVSITCKGGFPENLDEMFARKGRITNATWPCNQLENASNHHIWQPETLMYTDNQTGHEVWRLSNTPGSKNYYHNDIVLNPWSADGKRLSWSSQERPTSAFDNYDGWSENYARIWMIMESDGSFLRTPVNTARRTVGSNALIWSQQLPDTYYQMGDDHYLGSNTTPGTLYKLNVSDTEVVRQALIAGFSYGERAIDIAVNRISPDGKRIMVRDGSGGSMGYSSVALFPATIYPEDEVNLSLPDGYPYFRDPGMSNYSNTPSFFDHAHADSYRLLGPDGEWYRSMPSGSQVRWKFKTLGSAADGGPLWTDDLIPPVDEPPYDFGEIIPVFGCDPNPFGTPYMSHDAPDRWGRLFIHSCCCVPECWGPVGIGPGVWDTRNHEFVVATFGGGAQHHDWHGFTDWTASSRGSGDDVGCLALGYPVDLNYTYDRLYTQKYDDADSQETVCYTHTLYNSYGCYGGEYYALPRPAQSPDGTKIAFHSTFLNIKTGEDDSPDIYWAVAYYPYPPTDLGACYEGGVKLSWLPPRYTERGWPNETMDPAPYAREIKAYHLWRASSQTGPWQEIGSVNASYHVDDYYGLVHDINTLQFIDNPGDGVSYYALTSEEHSGLESHELSEIMEVTVSGTSVMSTVVQSKGQKSFWTTAPQSPLNFKYQATGTLGQYQLSWTEPGDSKIRFYNAYYSNQSNPPADQRHRFASLPAGSSTYLDWVADPNSPGYYGITAVDRQGNEGLIVYFPTNDTTPPSRFNGQPTGTLSSGTTTVNISLSTDKQAVCRYSNVSGTNYTDMPFNFTSTNSTNHATPVSGLENGQSYTFYVRCNSSDGYVNEDDWNISFSIDGHKADLNDDDIIDMPELMAYLARWKAGDGVSKAEVEDARGIWLAGGVY